VSTQRQGYNAQVKSATNAQNVGAIAGETSYVKHSRSGCSHLFGLWRKPLLQDWFL